MANNKQNSIIKLKDKTFFQLLTTELIKHGRVKITGLGIFKLKVMKEHSRYVPGNKRVNKIKKHTKLTFTPTRALKEQLQKYNGK